MQRKLVIYLYSAVPLAKAHVPSARSLARRIKRSIRRLWIHIVWTATHQLVGHHSDIASGAFSNRGDIALSHVIEEQLRSALPHYSVEIRELAWGRIDSSAIEEINAEGDAFVVGGGGFLHFIGGSQLNPRLEADCQFFDAIDIPIFGYGLGANCFLADAPTLELNLSERSKTALSLLAGNLRFATVRDPLAAEVLGGFGAKVTQTIDPAFFLQPAESTPQPLPNTSNRPKIGLNLAAHGPSTFRDLQRNIKEYVKFLRQVQAKLDCDFFYFIHSDSEHFVVDLLRSAGIHVSAVDEEPRTMLHYYRQVDVHICQMMHSAILAMSVGTPTMNIAYDIKNVMFFNELGASEFCIPSAQADAKGLARIFERLWGCRNSLKSLLFKERARLEPRHHEAIGRLADSLSLIEKRT